MEASSEDEPESTITTESNQLEINFNDDKITFEYDNGDDGKQKHANFSWNHFHENFRENDFTKK